MTLLEHVYALERKLARYHEEWRTAHNDELGVAAMAVGFFLAGVLIAGLVVSLAVAP